MNWKYDKDKITYFADTDFRGQRVRFGIRAEDRARHIYIIGKTGMGKSTLLENLAVQDIQNGEGMCFIDPHGGTAELLLKYVPKERINDVIYFAPFDMEYPVAMNVLEKADMSKRPLIASGLLGAFKKVWPDSFSARMEYMLSNSLLALLEMPGATLLGVNRMLADKAYRDSVIENITDSSVKSFWIDEFGKWTDKMVAEAVPAIQNKVGQFSANPVIRNILGQPESTFDIRWIMDNRKIFIVNLSKGRIGESNAALLGALLITKMYLAAMSRAEANPEELKELPPFYLYVDEFQSFANESFADILSEARKYKLCLTVAHQYIEQMTDEVRAAVFGNVGTMISFRVGSTDGEALEKEFAPVFTVDDFVSLGFAQVYLKLMIKGASSAPFSARTRDKPPVPEHTYENEVIEASRAQFSRPRAEVEKNLEEWLRVNSSSPNASGNAPQTKKFAPGMRPDRPRFDGGAQGGGGQQGGRDFSGGSNAPRFPNSERRFDGGQQSQSGHQGPQQNRVGAPLGIGLRDALVRVGGGVSQSPSSQQGGGQQHSQGYNNQQQPPQDQYQQVNQGYANMQQPQPQQYQQQMPPQYPAVPQYQQPGMYPYQGQPQMQPMQPMQPMHYGYPYILPPAMPQYGYPGVAQYPVQQYVPQHPYPPAPPYGYQPTHPGYGQFVQPNQGQPLQQQRQVEARPAYASKQPERTPEKQPEKDVIQKDEPRKAPITPVAFVKPALPQVRPINKSEDQARTLNNDRNSVVENPQSTRPVIKPNLVRKNDNKGPSAENIDSLSAALAKLKQKADSMPQVGGEPVIKEPTAEPAEVPREVLKKVLEE